MLALQQKQVLGLAEGREAGIAFLDGLVADVGGLHQDPVVEIGGQMDLTHAVAFLDPAAPLFQCTLRCEKLIIDHISGGDNQRKS